MGRETAHDDLEDVIETLQDVLRDGPVCATPERVVRFCESEFSVTGYLPKSEFQRFEYRRYSVESTA